MRTVTLWFLAIATFFSDGVPAVAYTCAQWQNNCQNRASARPDTWRLQPGPHANGSAKAKNCAYFVMKADPPCGASVPSRGKATR